MIHFLNTLCIYAFFGFYRTVKRTLSVNLTYQEFEKCNSIPVNSKFKYMGMYESTTCLVRVKKVHYTCMRSIFSHVYQTVQFVKKFENGFFLFAYLILILSLNEFSEKFINMNIGILKVVK